MSEFTYKLISKKWVSVSLVLILLFLISFFHIRLRDYAFDDAYIHFRVARNFVETGYPYYNANDILKVSTNTAWMLLLTLIYSSLQLFHLQESLPLFVSILNTLCTFFCLLIYLKLVEKIVEKNVSFTQKSIFFISFTGLLLPSSIGLMETPISLLVFGLGLILITSQKPIGGLFIGISIYFRIEMVIPALIAFLFLLLKKQLNWKPILWGLMGVLPFLVFDLYYFGTIIPQSIIAKPVVYDLKRSQTLSTILFTSIPPTNLFDSTALNAIIFVVLIILVFYTLIKRKCINLECTLFFWGWGVSIITFYLVGKAFVFEWYQALYTIPLFLSCFILYEKTKIKVIKIHLIVFSIILSTGLFSTLLASLGHYQRYSYFVGGSRVKTYLNVGKILYAEYPDSDLLTSEIGGLGYSFQGEIIDAAGLATDQALVFHPMLVPQERSSEGIGGIPPAFVHQVKPDLIVSYEHFIEALLKDNILDEYSEILVPAFLPEDERFSEGRTIWGSKYLRIYVRKGLPISTELLDYLRDE